MEQEKPEHFNKSQDKICWVEAINEKVKCQRSKSQS